MREVFGAQRGVDGADDNPGDGFICEGARDMMDMRCPRGLARRAKMGGGGRGRREPAGMSSRERMSA